jgi:hypothetical protein
MRNYAVITRNYATRIFVLTATNNLRVSRKSHLRDHPSLNPLKNEICCVCVMKKNKKFLLAGKTLLWPMLK